MTLRVVPDLNREPVTLQDYLANLNEKAVFHAMGQIAQDVATGHLTAADAVIVTEVIEASAEPSWKLPANAVSHVDPAWAEPAPDDGFVVGVKYPHVAVQLSGQDDNAFAILGRIQKAMKEAGISTEEYRVFEKEATSGTYDELLRTAMRWVKVS